MGFSLGDGSCARSPRAWGAQHRRGQAPTLSLVLGQCESHGRTEDAFFGLGSSPFIFSLSDLLPPSLPLLLAVPGQGSAAQTAMRMLSRPLQPGCVLGMCPYIARAHHPPPGEPRGSGGLQDPNPLSLLLAYEWVAAFFMKCWVEGYWGFPFH